MNSDRVITSWLRRWFCPLDRRRGQKTRNEVVKLDRQELIQETIDHIKNAELNEVDVEWVGSHDGSYAISFDEFKQLGPVYYDPGFGGQEIARDLVVVFKDGSWLERWEYDGSEGWTRNLRPIISSSPKKITKVRSEFGDELGSLHKETRYCENCECELSDHEDGWCDSCSLPEERSGSM